MTKEDEDLFDALYSNNRDGIEKAINNGANLNAIARDGETPIFYAVAQCDVSVINLLIQKGADIKGENEVRRQDTLLHRAIENDNAASVIDFLLEKGERIEVKNWYGWTPLHMAARFYTPTKIDLLLQKGAKIEAIDKKGYTPLHHSAETDMSLNIDLLLQKGANIEARDDKGGTPLHAAAQSHQYASVPGYDDKQAVSCIAAINSLIQNGANIEAIDNEGRTPLHCAIAYTSHQDPIGTRAHEVLVENRANINTQDRDGNTPLHSAATLEFESLKKCKFLLQNGAMFYVKNNEGKTPLDIAKSLGDTKVIKLLEDLRTLNDIWNADKLIPKAEIENKIKSCDTKNFETFILNKQHNASDKKIDLNLAENYIDHNRNNMINNIRPSFPDVSNSKNPFIKSLEETSHLKEISKNPPPPLFSQTLKVIKTALAQPQETLINHKGTWNERLEIEAKYKNYAARAEKLPLPKLLKDKLTRKTPFSR